MGAALQSAALHCTARQGKARQGKANAAKGNIVSSDRPCACHHPRPLVCQLASQHDDNDDDDDDVCLSHVGRTEAHPRSGK